MENNLAHSGAIGAGILMVALVVLAIALIPMVFYILTLQKALRDCFKIQKRRNFIGV